MKNKIVLALISITILFNLISCTNLGQVREKQEELNYQDIVNKIIRFHVLANSDSEEDQNLKLKVRDEVIEAISYKLKDCKTIDEARETVVENKEYIEGIAQNVVEDNGYNYKVTSMLSKENFPDKVYGDVIFPQGEYEAYRILIGNAKGQNWWCVMFPPLCFVDETKDVIDSNEIKENIEKSSVEEKKDTDDRKIKFKFKFFEFLFKNKS